MMKTSPLHNHFGVEVHDVDLQHVRKDQDYPEIRTLFDEHSVLLFRNQALDEDEQIALAQLFGPIEDRSEGVNGPDPVVSMVNNIGDSGKIAEPDSMHVKQLRANQLWHTDSTFLPVPALTNIAIGRVIPSSGGETEFVSTRVAWREMPPRVEGKSAWCGLLASVWSLSRAN